MSNAAEATARVYLKNGHTFYVQDRPDPSAAPTSGIKIDAYDEISKAMLNPGTNLAPLFAVEILTTKGEQVTVPLIEILTCARHGEVLPEIRVDEAIFDGRGIEIRSAASFWSPRHDDEAMDPGSDEGVVRDMVPRDVAGFHVVAVAEDMASAVVVIVDLRNGEATWINPAASPRTIDLYVEAIKTLAAAESHEVEFQEPKPLALGDHVRVIEDGPLFGKTGVIDDLDEEIYRPALIVLDEDCVVEGTSGEKVIRTTRLARTRLVPTGKPNSFVSDTTPVGSE